MHDYADAIRDYQYLRSKKSIDATDMASRKLRLQRFFMSKNDFKDPFQSHYSYFKESGKRIDPLRKSLMRRLPSWLSFSAEERRQRQKEYHEGAPPNEVSRFVDGLVRFGIAFTGGAFLVVPMIIMVLDPSQTKSLVTVSAFVVLFSLLLSLVVRVSNVETLVSTATYAAVLVVFVGTSTNNQST
ncbi:hypothetical protein GQ53DRAFT_742268 [Thozetella sp. PMI_491]|nr:hypothetical protein GQ53DRAFT_742268 [Thozetella sp. PMI_491]